MGIKNGIIIDDIAYECVRGEGENVSLRRIGKLKDILIPEHKAIDLGLSVKWASCNVGAENPSDYGGYYAWGETKPKWDYSRENCKTYDKNMGNVAGNPKYDVARAVWGSPWRLPTEDEIAELVNKCTVEWTTQGGHNGYKITGSNGNSIFLPAAGCHIEILYNYVGEDGYYWSAMSDKDFMNSACCLDFNSKDFCSSWGRRYYGCSVRPVTE